MKRLASFVVLTLIALSTYSDLFAQKQVAIPNMEIQLRPADGSRGPRQTTSMDGTFSFENLAEGTYTVYIAPKQCEQAALLMPALMKAKEKANRTRTVSTGAADVDASDETGPVAFSINFTKIEMTYFKQDASSNKREAGSGQSSGKRIFNWTGIFDESAAPQLVVDKKGGSLSGEIKGTYDLKTMTK